MNARKILAFFFEVTKNPRERGDDFQNGIIISFRFFQVHPYKDEELPE